MTNDQRFVHKIQTNIQKKSIQNNITKSLYINLKNIYNDNAIIQKIKKNSKYQTKEIDIKFNT